MTKLGFKRLKGRSTARARPKFTVHFKPVEMAILFGVILLGTSGIIYLKFDKKAHQQLNIVPSSSQSSDNNCLLSNAGCPDNQSSSKPSQPTQTATTNTPSTTTKPSSTSTQSQNGECGAPGSSGYQECINNVNYINLSLKCGDETTAADNALMAVVNPAKATYNTDIASKDQQAESDYPAGSYTLSQVEYNIENGEIAKYNDTVSPAWATYQSAYATINSQGCNQQMTFSESDIMMSPLPSVKSPTFQ